MKILLLQATFRVRFTHGKIHFQLFKKYRKTANFFEPKYGTLFWNQHQKLH